MLNELNEISFNKNAVEIDNEFLDKNLDKNDKNF